MRARPPRPFTGSILRIVCAGDAQAAPLYPRFLEEILKERGIRAEVRDRRVQGVSSGAMVSLLENDLAAQPPDMVLVTLGGTDRELLLPRRKQDANRSLSSLRTLALFRQLKERFFPSVPQQRREKQPAEVARAGDPSRKMAWWYRRRGQYDRSVEAFKKAIEDDPRDTEAYFGLGWYYMAHGEFSRCKDLFLKGLEADPDNYRMYIELAWTYMHMGENAKAMALRERVKRMKPRLAPGLKPADRLIELGRWAMLRGEYGRALSCFRKAASIEPETAGAYFGLGWWLIAEGDYDEAEKVIEEGGRLNPGDWPYVELGRCYKHQGDLPRAIETFQRSIRINPRNDAAWLGLGPCYAELGRHAEAIETFNKALEANPKSYGAFLGLGRSYSAQGRKREAVAMLEKAVALSPMAEDAYIELAQIYFLNGETQSLRVTIEQWQKTMPGNARLFIRLGQWYLSRGSYKEAEGALEEAAAMTPEDAEPYVWLGRCAAAQGHYKDALEAFEKAGEPDPQEETLELYRGYCRLHLGDTAAAAASFRAASVAREAFYNPLTRRSFERLQRIAAGKGIRLIRVEYPLRTEGFLETEKDGGKELLTLSRGRYGECTVEGSRLLAERIAEAVAAELRGRQKDRTRD